MKIEEIKRELDLTIVNKENDIMYISKLKKNKDKVKYLRLVKRYTQEESADIIGISVRHLQRIEREIKIEG